MKKVLPKGAHSVHGLDISHYQPVVNFQQVKAGGNHFVFIKASEGARSKDDKYELHKAEAKAAGLLMGAYHFFHYDQDPIAQARHFCEVAGKDCDMPHTLDIEWSDRKKKGILGKDGAALAMKCLAEIERISGRTPIIYTSAAFFIGAPDPHFFSKYPLWVASYRSDGAVIPTSWSNWKFWQYTDHEYIKGVGKIDADHFNGSLDDLYRFCGKQPPKAKTASIMGLEDDSTGDDETLEYPEKTGAGSADSSQSMAEGDAAPETENKENVANPGEEIFTPPSETNDASAKKPLDK